MNTACTRRRATFTQKFRSMLTEGTIIALSTAAGAGAARGHSPFGEAAIATTERLFVPRTLKCLGEQKYSIHLGDIKAGEQIIDEVLVSLFKNPHSYTGEDVVEISCHGSRYIQEEILQLFIQEEYACTTG